MKKMLILLLSLALLFSFAGCSQNNPSLPDDPDKDLSTENNDQSSIDNKDDSNGENLIYQNAEYGFDFTLPKTWQGYQIVMDKWTSNNPDIDASGPMISIRNPLWTEKQPYQDIPILVFTLDQWQKISKEEFNVSAAPIPPSKLGENSQYIFALPPRYNFAYPKGFEEVEKIIKGSPLTGTSPGANSSPGDSSEAPVDN